MNTKHTKLGIASFLLTCTAGMGLFCLIAITAILHNVRHVEPDAARLGHALFVLCLFAICGANLTALGLGIAGLVQAECKKLFAILGTVLALMELMLMLLLLVLISRG